MNSEAALVRNDPSPASRQWRNAALPSWDRYKSLFLKGQGLSILRAMEYETIAHKILRGKTLDFGGGAKAKYKHLLKCEQYESANIDPLIEPTWLMRVGGKLPCPDQTYDTVISLNTFEHIYDVPPVIRDIHRVMKSSGTFIFSVPFLYPVHGHPDDFCRYTASWWFQNLQESGFSEIIITPHFWGPFTTGATCSGVPGPFRKIRTHAALLMDLLYTRLRFGTETATFSGDAGKYLQNHALGYFIEAKK